MKTDGHAFFKFGEFVENTHFHVMWTFEVKSSTVVSLDHAKFNDIGLMHHNSWIDLPINWIYVSGHPGYVRMRMPLRSFGSTIGLSRSESELVWRARQTENCIVNSCNPFYFRNPIGMARAWVGVRRSHAVSSHRELLNATRIHHIHCLIQ